MHHSQVEKKKNQNKTFQFAFKASFGFRKAVCACTHVKRCVRNRRKKIKTEISSTEVKALKELAETSRASFWS